MTLSLAKQRYGVEEPLLVTIHNGLQTDIALADGGAGCVSIEVERLVQDSWQSVSQCAPAPAGRKSVVISAGSAFVQRIELRMKWTTALAASGHISCDADVYAQ